MQTTPQLRPLTKQPTAVRRAVLPPDQVADWIPPACALVAETLRHRGIGAAGFPFARRHPRPDNLVEVEAGFPVAAPVPPSGPVSPSSLPGGAAVAAWHTDPRERLDTTYEVIDDWLAAGPARPAGDSWEIYHDLPTCPATGTRIEVVQPVALDGAVPVRPSRTARCGSGGAERRARPGRG